MRNTLTLLTLLLLSTAASAQMENFDPYAKFCLNFVQSIHQETEVENLMKNFNSGLRDKNLRNQLDKFKTDYLLIKSVSETYIAKANDPSKFYYNVQIYNKTTNEPYSDIRFLFQNYDDYLIDGWEYIPAQTQDNQVQIKQTEEEPTVTYGAKAKKEIEVLDYQPIKESQEPVTEPISQDNETLFTGEESIGLDDAVVQLIRISNSQSNWQTTVDALFQNDLTKSKVRLNESQLRELRNHFLTKGYNIYVQKVADVYRKNFTTEEIIALANFYRDPAGRSVLNKMSSFDLNTDDIAKDIKKKMILEYLNVE